MPLNSDEKLTPVVAVLSDSFTEKDFIIDCDGCTACCRGHHGVKLDDEELADFPEHLRYKDPRGEWRLKQEDGKCVFLLETEDWAGCSIHDEVWTEPCDKGYPQMAMPRRCREFDCRAAVITYSNIGIDELVAKGELPLSVVEMGRKKLREFNQMLEVRALSGGADLSFLMQKEDPDDAS